MQSRQRLFGSVELIRENWIIVSSFRCPLHCCTLLHATARLSCTEETILAEAKTAVSLEQKQLTLDFLVICVRIFQTETVESDRTKSVRVNSIFFASVVEDPCNLGDQG